MAARGFTRRRSCQKRADLPCFLLFFPSLTCKINQKRNTGSCFDLFLFLDLFSGSSPGSVPCGSAAMDFISFFSGDGSVVKESRSVGAEAAATEGGRGEKVGPVGGVLGGCRW